MHRYNLINLSHHHSQHQFQETFSLLYIVKIQVYVILQVYVICPCAPNNTTQTWMLRNQNEAEISERGSKLDDTVMTVTPTKWRTCTSTFWKNHITWESVYTSWQQNNLTKTYNVSRYCTNGSRGRQGRSPPGSKFFHFHAVFGKHLTK